MSVSRELLPNSARPLLSGGVAHLDDGGRGVCGWNAGRMVRVSLVQAVVWVRPVWCPRCFRREAS